MIYFKYIYVKLQVPVETEFVVILFSLSKFP